MEISVITILSHEVLDDIRSAAWLESELHEDLPLHRRHEMADICEEENVARIWRVLGLCDAEIRMAIRRILAGPSPVGAVNTIECPEKWEYPLAAGVRSDAAVYLKEKIHDFMVASVLADRAEVIIPECAPVWQQRAEDALSALSEGAAAATAGTAVRRRLCPF